MNFKRSTTSMAIAIMALSLISMTAIQQDAFAQSQGISITATADKGSDTITVTGKTTSDYTDVTFTVTSPSGNNVVAIDQVTPDENGNFGTEFKVGLWTEDGFYTIQAKQGPGIYTLSVDVEVNNGMTEKTSETLSTLDADLFAPNLPNTARIMAAIVPNSGITKVPIISICSAPARNMTVTLFATISTSSHSSPSTSTMKIPSWTVFEGVTVNIPSSSAFMLMIIELSLVLRVASVTIPPEILYGIH